ncbi:MAG: hypothetical protein ACM3ZV_06910 [Bacillota bacterium]
MDKWLSSLDKVQLRPSWPALLRYEQISGNTYIDGDTNGDGYADFMICVTGAHTLTSGDFVL